MTHFPVQEGEILAGKYRVGATIGEGGMGLVVSATHIELDQQVAVKLMLPALAQNSNIAERFRREARAACKITSPHVARILDVGTTEQGLPFMVMEYLTGHDLAEELSKRQRLPIEEAVSCVMQAADAIAEAHAAGIVHRDIKPANLFLARRGSRTLVKVLDFGISKSLTESDSGQMVLTQTASMMGSPVYMSPEQLESARNVDETTDIWALGVVLYELICGTPPFMAETVPALFRKVADSEPPPLSTHGVDAPEGLEQVVLKCLQKNKADRFQSVQELTAALAPFAPSVPSITGGAALSLGNPGSNAVSEQPSDQKTQVGWGGTQSPTKSRRWPLWLAAAFVVMGAVGIWIVMRGPAADAETPPGEAAASAGAPLPPATSAQPVVDEPPTVETSEVQDDAPPAASATPEASSPAATATSQPTATVHRPKPAAPSIKPSPPKQRKQEDKTQPSSAQPPPVTDFGGRR